MLQYRNVGLVVRKGAHQLKDELNKVVCALADWGAAVFLEQEITEVGCPALVTILPTDTFINQVDVIVTLGGDGSFLSGAQLAIKRDLPVIGINCGKVGFLSDLLIEDLQLLQELLSGAGEKEERAILQVECKAGRFFALNEVAIFAYTTGSLLGCTVKVDRCLLGNYQVDGLIVATPTGSTGHALSAGGSVVTPSLKILEIVPLLSTNHNVRPVMVSEEAQIEVVVEQESIERYLAVFDGQVQQVLDQGQLMISKGKVNLHLLHPKNYDYYARLRAKLKW